MRYTNYTLGQSLSMGRKQRKIKKCIKIVVGNLFLFFAECAINFPKQFFICFVPLITLKRPAVYVLLNSQMLFFLMYILKKASFSLHYRYIIFVIFFFTLNLNTSHYFRQFKLLNRQSKWYIVNLYIDSCMKNVFNKEYKNAMKFNP